MITNLTDSQPPQADRIKSLGEEIANAVSHGAGVIGFLVGTPFLVLAALRHGHPAGVVAVSVFAFSGILLYLSSTIYHALPNGRAKDAFEVLDHSAIYLLIAGTYTPFTLGPLRGSLGWTLFGIVWGLAVVGVTMKLLHGIKRPVLSTLLYIGMGWLVLIAARSLWLHLPTPGLIWLAAGGLAYTGGTVFYLARWRPYAHTVWHVFVLAGTTCHYFAVLWYSL